MIVVADTSVLINLSRVNQGGLLQKLFHEVVIPPEVRMEFQKLAAISPRFTGLLLPEGVHERTPSTVPSYLQSERGLDSGELAALSLALEIHADAILIDERRGHQIAVKLGLQTVGIIGILLQAKSVGYIPAITPVLDALQNQAGFWISEKLRKQILQLAEET